MTHPPQQPLDELQALVGHVRFREGLLADFGMALTRNGETVSDSILGSDLSETAPVLGRAADTLERQAQEIQRLREALTNAREAMALSVSIPPEDERCRSVVTILCEQYGYGAIMSEASRQWREKLGDLAGGEFCAGPCRSTAEIAIAKIDAALSSQGE